MPIYEYHCRDCGHELEKLQKMSDAPLTDCPSCDTPNLVKKVSAAGFQLKGTGWYATDFKHKGKPQTADNKKTASKSDNKTKQAEA
nr:zinc ribbon domain-containing protein [Marinicella sp. NBU2979]